MSAPASEQQQQSTALPAVSERLTAPVEVQAAEEQAAEQVQAPTRRLVALDAWRGLTIVLMLLVNNVALGQFTPAELIHAPWGGGLTLTDLVFPWFLFCAGAALPFSLGKLTVEPRWWPDLSTARKLLTRAAALYLVGALLTSVANQAPSLGLGVLQLIALASLGAGLLARLPVAGRLGVALALLAAYQVFLLSAPFTETDNAVTRLNSLLLGDLGLRGLTSLLPATALALLGSVATQPLRNRLRELPSLLGLGAALTLGGWLLSGVMGYNKTVWTPAYVLYSAGLGTLGLLAFYLIGDARGGRQSAVLSPLTIAGRNSLFAYTAPILLKLWVLGVWKVNWTGQPLSILNSLLLLSRRGLGVQAGGWLYSLGYVGAVWLALWLLSRRGWIWKL